MSDPRDACTGACGENLRGMSGGQAQVGVVPSSGVMTSYKVT
jgi:hypothetical protein